MVFRLVFIWLLPLCSITLTSNAQTPVIVELCNLPSAVSESSGLENGPNGWFWTHNDSGNNAELYCVDTAGVLQRTVAVVGDVNTDWEEIAKDQDGNLFIGNFGNNALNRTDLRIVKIPSIDTCTISAHVTDTIRFTYPDQSSFPPNGSYGNFDMEAFFFYQDSLHLFSKDRSDPGTGYTKHYVLPSVGGTYQALLKDSFLTQATSFVFAVTAADISEDGNQAVLLSSNKIWLFRNFNGTQFFDGDVAELNLSVFSQKEGICFRNDFLYITDEKSFGMGGKMYRLHPDVFVSIEERAPALSVKPVYNTSGLLQEIHLPGTEVYIWKLLSTDGKLLQTGSARDTLSASAFHQNPGLYIIQISDRKTDKSVLIQL